MLPVNARAALLMGKADLSPIVLSSCSPLDARLLPIDGAEIGAVSTKKPNPASARAKTAASSECSPAAKSSRPEPTVPAFEAACNAGVKVGEADEANRGKQREGRRRQP